MGVHKVLLMSTYNILLLWKKSENINFDTPLSHVNYPS